PAARADRTHVRARGLHEQRRPDHVPAPPVTDQRNGARSLPQATRPVPAAAEPWPSPGSWQGGGIGAIAPVPSSADPPFRPTVSPAPRAASYRSGRGAGADSKSGGPPWAPAPEPGRTFGPLPVASPGSPPPEPGPGIRLPGDMALPQTAVGEPPAPHPLAGLDTPTPPAGFAMTPPLSDFAPPLAAPDFGAPPVAPDFGPPSPGPDFGPPSVASDFGVPPATFEFGPPLATDFPAQENLGFAAAPVVDDYVAPFPPEPPAQDDPAPGPAADPSFIWDLAATDVFPAATETGPSTETADGPDLPN
ncbi:MAG: hypothetical protein ACRDOU_30280, partial [Streptosporangiaceae bacterium]